MLQLKKSEDGEKITTLDRTVKNIVVFIEKGGVIDFVAPEIEQENGDNQKLRVAFQEIRRLEDKIALLGHKTD